jgi:hypothetical protein
VRAGARTAERDSTVASADRNSHALAAAVKLLASASAANIRMSSSLTRIVPISGYDVIVFRDCLGG